MVYKLPEDREYLLERIKNTPFKREVVIRKIKRPRSLSQNALYWFWLNVIAFETGEIAENLHEFFKQKFLPRENMRVLGKDLKATKSTTDLSSEQFNDYMGKIYMEITENQIADLKWPEEALYDEWRKNYEERY